MRQPILVITGVVLFMGGCGRTGAAVAAPAAVRSGAGLRTSTTTPADSARAVTLIAFLSQTLLDSRASNTSISTGLVRWWSKPASIARCRSLSCPHPVNATRHTPAPHGSSRSALATS